MIIRYFLKMTKIKKEIILIVILGVMLLFYTFKENRNSELGTNTKEEIKVETEKEIPLENTDILTRQEILSEQVSSGEPLSGGDESFQWYMEDKSEWDAMVLFEEFGEMDYAVFLETYVGYPETLMIPVYGIYGDITKTAGEGVDIYLELNKKMIGIEIPATTITNPDAWYGYTGEYIVSMSPDMEWVASRQTDDGIGSSFFGEKWYEDKNLARTIESNGSMNIGQFVLSRTDSGKWEPLSKHKYEQVQNLLNESFFRGITEYYNRWFCLDESGNLLAVRGKENEDDNTFDIYQKECIRIYDVSGEQAEKLYEFPAPETEVNWYIEISQIVGNEHKGWLVFSAGPKTYRMQYPDGSMEEIGEYMYSATYSPDGKYIAYCTGNVDNFDSWEDMYKESEADEELMAKYWEMRDQWDSIPAGWYVEELETGNKTYIPIKTYIRSRHHNLASIGWGHCIWIEKKKLLENLDC